MLGVVFVRKLREGMTYDDFREAWFPDVGFGVPARVISGRSPWPSPTGGYPFTR
jgi:hypothetical protein